MLIAGCMLAFTGCKKDDNGGDDDAINAIVGKWYESKYEWHDIEAGVEDKGSETYTKNDKTYDEYKSDGSLIENYDGGRSIKEYSIIENGKKLKVVYKEDFNADGKIADDEIETKIFDIKTLNSTTLVLHLEVSFTQEGKNYTYKGTSTYTKF